MNHWTELVTLIYEHFLQAVSYQRGRCELQSTGVAIAWDRGKTEKNKACHIDCNPLLAHSDENIVHMHALENMYFNYY